MRFKEIFILCDMLLGNNIPFKLYKLFDGYQIVVTIRKKEISCIETSYSIGNENDKLELRNGLKEEELKYYPDSSSLYGCVGNLTAYEVFERIEYCYKNNRLSYKEA